MYFSILILDLDRDEDLDSRSGIIVGYEVRNSGDF